MVTVAHVCKSARAIRILARFTQGVPHYVETSYLLFNCYYGYRQYATTNL